MTRNAKGGAACLVALGLALAWAPGRAEAGGMTAIGTVQSTSLATPGDDGHLHAFGTGVGASILLMDVDDDVSGGFEGQTLFLIGKDGRRLYDLGLSLIASFEVEHEVAVPYVKAGLDLAAAADAGPDPDGAHRYVMLGVHGAIGVHGFLSKCIYWRGEVGYHGAGIGGLTGQLGIGYVFGD